MMVRTVIINILISLILVSCVFKKSIAKAELEVNNIEEKILNEFNSQYLLYRKGIEDYCGKYDKNLDLDYSNKQLLVSNIKMELVVVFINQHIKLKKWDSLFLVNYIYDGSYTTGEEFSQVYSLVSFSDLQIIQHYFISVDNNNKINLLTAEKYKAIYDYFTRIDQRHSCEAGLSSIIKFNPKAEVDKIKVVINPNYLIEYNIDKVPKEYRLKKHLN